MLRGDRSMHGRVCQPSEQIPERVCDLALSRPTLKERQETWTERLPRAVSAVGLIRAAVPCALEVDRAAALTRHRPKSVRSKHAGIGWSD